MTEILRNAHVGLAGCGGIGSNAAMALARAGVGHLILVDYDKVEMSNLNRQYFFQSDLGKPKVEALASHIKSVNPEINLDLHFCEIIPQNVATLFHSADILIEAFDIADRKAWLISQWEKLFPDRPIICGNGLSGFGKSNDLRVIKAGNIYFCGDLKTDMSMGLCSARVALVANMQANVAIELLITGKTEI